MKKIISFIKKMFNKNENNEPINDIILAEDCIIYRSDINVVYLDSSLEEVLYTFKKSKQKLLLVCDENLDNIVGVCDVFNYKEQFATNNFNKPVYLTENSELQTFILDLVKQDFLHIIIDEFGGTKGIVTLESVFRYLLNNTQNLSLNLQEESIIDGKMLLINFINITNININIEDYDSKTVSGFLMEYLGKIPHEGDMFLIENVEFQIISIKERHINSVKIRIMNT